MKTIAPDWLEHFDQAMLAFYAIDHVDAGMEEKELGWYRDLPPREAALAYGEDYELCRVDTFWPARDATSDRDRSDADH